MRWRVSARAAGGSGTLHDVPSRRNGRMTVAMHQHGGPLGAVLPRPGPAQMLGALRAAALARSLADCQQAPGGTRCRLPSGGGVSRLGVAGLSQLLRCSILVAARGDCRTATRAAAPPFAECTSVAGRASNPTEGVPVVAPSAGHFLGQVYWDTGSRVASRPLHARMSVASGFLKRTRHRARGQIGL